VSAPTREQLEALLRLWPIAQRDHGGARVVCVFLLGLYNGRRFPFDLTNLRLLDIHVLRDVMLVLQMDSSPQVEVHEHLNRLLGRRDIGDRFELLACDWRLKGKCSRENERSLRAALPRYEEAVEAAGSAS
jgi:hypothetical protein